MSKYLYPIVIILLIFPEAVYPDPLSKDEAIVLFSKANGEYELATRLLSEKKEGAAFEGFSNASGLYERILDSGFNSGQIHYNLGNAYYRQGELGKAVLSYRRAQRLLPRNEDLKANLKLVKEEIKDKEKKPSAPAVVQTLLFLYFKLNANEATVLALSFYFIVIVLVHLLIFFRTSWLKTLSISFGVCLALTTASLIIKICPHHGTEGVVIAETCKLRYGPGQEYETKLELHEGTELLIEQETEGWLKAYVYVDVAAQMSDTKDAPETKENEKFKTGWLPADKVGKI